VLVRRFIHYDAARRFSVAWRADGSDERPGKEISKKEAAAGK
jgi:hypothetical protein